MSERLTSGEGGDSLQPDATCVAGNEKNNASAQWRCDPLLWTLVALSSSIGAIHLWLIFAVSFVGYNDPAAYGDVANHLLAGSGFQVNFIDAFHELSTGLPRPTDHWFSLYSLIVAAISLPFGLSAFTVKLPSLIAFCCFPVLLYVLGSQTFSRWTGFFAALVILLHPTYLHLSLLGYPDHLFNCLALIVVLLVVRAEDKPHFLSVAAFFSGLLVLTKSLALVFLCSIALALVSRGHWRGCLRPKAVLWAVLVFLLTVSPLVVRNLLTFQDPSLGYYRYLMVTLGYGDNAYHDHYQVFREGPPTLERLITVSGAGGIATRVGSTFLDVFRGNHYFSYQPGLPRLMHAWLLFILSAAGLLMLRRHFVTRVTFFLTVMLIAFSSLLFAYQYRYFLLPIALLFLTMFEFVAVVWTGIVRRYLAGRIKGASERTGIGAISLSASRHAPGALCLLLVLVLYSLPRVGALFETPRRYPRAEEQFMMQVMNMVIVNTDRDERLMSALPACIAFHTGRPSIMVPYGSMADVFDIAHRYEVTWFLDVVGHSDHFFGEFPELLEVDRVRRPGQLAVLYRLMSTPPWSGRRFDMPNRFLFPSSHAMGDAEDG